MRRSRDEVAGSRKKSRIAGRAGVSEDNASDDTAASKCPVWCRAQAIVGGLGIPDHVLDPDFNLCYCGTCADLGGHDPGILSADRGDPPKTYAFPIGWCRFGMRLPPGVTTETMQRDHVAFHGTKRDAAVAIMQSNMPQLLLPGAETESGFVLPIRGGHIEGKFKRTNRYTGKEEMFDPNQIFMSPSIKYNRLCCFVLPRPCYALRSSQVL